MIFIFSFLLLFQSTPLMRGETTAHHSSGGRYRISIHSPHTRGDCPSPCRPSRRTYFNPLPSREGRHLGIDIDKAVREFQSTPLMRGETCSGLMRMLPLAFQSTPLVRGETALPKVPKGGESFQSTPLMRGETG